jgi:hypothetical protein
VRQAEPAAVARRLFRGVAGDAPGLPRRILATTVVSATVVVSIPVLIASVLGVLSGIGVLLNGIFPAGPRRGEPSVSWFLVSMITVAFLGFAVVVSWTSRRRDEARGGEPGDGAAGPPETGDATDPGADPAPGR